MPATYEPIATTTLGSAASSITFSGIPATYTDIRVVLTGKTVSQNYFALRFNSDTASNYSVTALYGTGSTAESFRFSNQTFIYFSINGTNTTYASYHAADIFSYAGSTNKTVLMNTAQDYNGAGTTNAQVGLWRSTSAITSVTILVSNGTNIATGTTATLYGIKSA